MNTGGVLSVPGQIDVTSTTGADDMSGNTLREAIIEANSLPGANTIILGIGTDTYALQIANTAGDEDAALEGDLDILDDLAIVAASTATTYPTIDASGQGDRVFHVITGTDVEFNGVTIQKGSTTGDGGGTLNENGVRLTINNCYIYDNEALPGLGGGIENRGELIVNNSYIDFNRADTGGGIDNSGNAVSAVVTYSIIANNEAASGGGGIKNGKDFIITNSTISGNTVSGGNGGGIDNVGTVSPATLTVNNSTISGNSAQEATNGASGGGLYNQFGNATIRSSTLYNNASDKKGGGIENDSNNAMLTILNSTISGNNVAGPNAQGGGGIANDGPGSAVELQNTILADNITTASAGPDCLGAITSLDNNLIGDTIGCALIPPGGLPEDNLNVASGLGTFIGLLSTPNDPGTPGRPGRGRGRIPLLDDDIIPQIPINSGLNTASSANDQLSNPVVDGNNDIGAIEYFGILTPDGDVTQGNMVVSFDPASVKVFPPDVCGAGTFTFTVTFTNTSGNPIQNPFFEVVQLSTDSQTPYTDENVLLNADGGPGGIGANLTLDVGVDGEFSPNEPVDVTFDIGLTTRNRFWFFLDLRGNEIIPQ